MGTVEVYPKHSSIIAASKNVARIGAQLIVMRGELSQILADSLSFGGDPEAIQKMATSEVELFQAQQRVMFAAELRDALAKLEDTLFHLANGAVVCTHTNFPQKEAQGALVNALSTFLNPVPVAKSTPKDPHGMS